ncbi:MAG: hypothetical protein ACU0BS_01715 [Hasllibacter sp.]
MTDMILSLTPQMRFVSSRPAEPDGAPPPRPRATARRRRVAVPSLVPALMGRLLEEIEVAASWADMTVRLARRGYALRAAADGLDLVRAADGRRLCSTADLGFAHRALAARFGAEHPARPPAVRFVLSAVRSPATEPACPG